MTTLPIATPASAPGRVSFEISPNPAFIDDDLHLRVDGLPPGEIVTIRAKTSDDEKREWRSHAQFMTDASGALNSASSESLDGTYRGISPMGLFWSMQLDEQNVDGRAVFAKKDTSPNHVSLEIESRGRIVASAQLARNYLAPGTETRDLCVPAAPELNGGVRTDRQENVREDAQGDLQENAQDDVPVNVQHTIGRLFIPPAANVRRPCPVVIVLSGSGGGFDLDKAAVLARHGFATLALAYFGIPPLPTWLHRIPLEYFDAAFGWLAAQPEIDSQRIGVLAVSRGAELALLLGSMFPQIRSIVAYAPSGVAWAASGRDKATGELIPSWTYRGTPVPFAPLPLRRFIFRSAIPVALLKRPVMFRNLFRAGLKNSNAISAAAIPVERIRGPIMLVSSGDDHLWPATKMSEAIVARLKDRNFEHRVEHLHYPHAGHMLRYPFLPTTARASRNPHLRNARFSFGGTASADAEAQADSWRRAIEFLHMSLHTGIHTSLHMGLDKGLH